MSFIFFVVHLVDIDLVWIFPGENVRNLEKDEVEQNFSFPPLEMGSLEPEGLVEIASAVIESLCREAEFVNGVVRRRSSVEEENGLLERCWGVYDAVLGSFFCFPA
ncbi:hypothetical protein RHSIM_Rhsim01G0081300 [Rhododendron simsii]|uniref:Uncharacterized protein n=1 Tax=Rhododendron simsii TaxID=118357 RepID=A0A834HH42_RHOSS|nr:hypothetical protein RHSIM_Rhsim01G0081300 [Rhododendron simsii]